MPAGAGPTCSVPVTSGSITTDANSVTVTSQAFNVNGAQGIIITVNLNWTPSATQTITCKLYQGSTSGTQVAPTAGLVATATGTTNTTTSFAFVDTSAYATGPTTAGQYVAGFTASTGTGTVTYSFVELDALATIL